MFNSKFEGSNHPICFWGSLVLPSPTPPTTGPLHRGNGQWNHSQKRVGLTYAVVPRNLRPPRPCSGGDPLSHNSSHSPCIVYNPLFRLRRDELNLNSYFIFTDFVEVRGSVLPANRGSRVLPKCSYFILIFTCIETFGFSYNLNGPELSSFWRKGISHLFMRHFE